MSLARCLLQIVHSNGKILFSLQKNCLSKFLQCTGRIFFIFIFLQGKLCASAHFSKSLAWSVFPCVPKNVIIVVIRLCLLHEDGIVEAYIPGSI